MAVKDLIAAGIGFTPGGVDFIVTRGLSPGDSVEEAYGGLPWWLGRRPVRDETPEPSLRDALLRRNNHVPPAPREATLREYLRKRF